MSNSQPYVVNFNQEARVALRSLDILPDNVSRTLFVMNDSEQIVGSLTDGDIRRGLLNGLEISHSIASFMNTSFKYLKNSNDNLDLIKSFRKADLNLIPLLDDQYRLLELLDLKRTITMIPVAALIMAGGRGERLRPLTDFQPKPMLKIGEKPIIEHNIDRLIFYGIKDIFISVKFYE